MSPMINRHSYKCKYCEAGFINSIGLKNHLHIHAEDKPHKCICCASSFLCVSELERHKCLQSVENLDIDKPLEPDATKPPNLLNVFCLDIGKSPYTCLQCNVKFSKISQLQEHMVLHLQEKQYKNSEAVIVKSDGLKNHLHICIRETPPQFHTLEKRLTCSQCDSSFACVSELQKLPKIHSDGYLYKCPNCQTTVSTSEPNEQHLLALEKSMTMGENEMQNVKIDFFVPGDEKPYKCMQCEASFSRSASLKNHSLIHIDEKIYKCTDCELDFSTFGEWKIHLGIHSRKRTFKCSHCKNSFLTSSSLKAHLCHHNGRKKYKCSQCRLSYTTEYSLKRHFHKHSGDNQYKCMFCPKTFYRSDQFKNHVIAHK